jgi:hypothetical protein
MLINCPYCRATSEMIENTWCKNCENKIPVEDLVHELCKMVDDLHRRVTALQNHVPLKDRPLVPRKKSVWE